MSLLILLTLLLLPLCAFAQSTAPIPQEGTITVVPTPLGTTYFSSNGSYTEVIGTPSSAQQSYTTHDGHGHVTTGFIFSPFAPTHFEPALSVPEYRGPVYDQASGQYLPPSYLGLK